MTVQPQQSDATDRASATLESWKEIASYLGRSVRAVQMWESDEGLPVHRHQHDKQGTVFAYQSELDAWLRDRTEKPEIEEVKPRSDKRVVTWIAAAGVLALLAAITWWISRDSSTAKATALPFGTRDWLLIAALENGSGENVFNGSIEYLLERELSDSQFIKVASRERIADVLLLMKRDPQSRIDRTMAREIALRDGSIQALLVPRIERLGSTYVIGLDIVATRTGSGVAKFSAKARTHDEVADAVTKLAGEVRPALGDQLVATDDDRLERVTTPSLRALQLFTEADRVIAYSDNVAAEKLLRGAIAEDPDFASAYMHLAFALSNQRKPATEYLPYAERAVALSQSATERERYFILGSHASMNNKLPEAVSHYQKLVQRYPDHFWGTNNLGGILKFRLGRGRDAAPYRLRLAELRPNQFAALFAAAESLYTSSDKPDEARQYFARAAELASPIDEERTSWEVAVARLHPAHLAWLAGDVTAVAAELEKWTARARAIGGAHGDMLLEHIAAFELAIGRADRARVIVESADIPASRARMSAHLAVWSGDCRTVRAEFDVVLKEPRARPPSLALLRMMQCGFRKPVKRLLASWPAGAPHRKVLLGVAAFQEGQRANGLMLIEEGFRSFDEVGGGEIAFYLASAEALAAVYDQAGQVDRAISVLEGASRHRRTTFFGGRSAWVEVRRDLARLYRKAGRENEATAVEDELRRITVS